MRRIPTCRRTGMADVGTGTTVALAIDLRRRTIVVGDADIRLQFTILLHRESIDTGEVGGLTEYPALGPVAVDAAHLPRLESQSQKTGAVGGVRIKRHQVARLFLHRIIGTRSCCRLLPCPAQGGRVGCLHRCGAVAVAHQVHHPESYGHHAESHHKHFAVGFLEIEKLPERHTPIVFRSNGTDAGRWLRCRWDRQT